VGKLAIAQFIAYQSLEAHIGHCVRCRYASHEFDLIPLPHPSGASPWPRQEPGKSLLHTALKLIAAHPSIMALATLPEAQE
jgi:uracil-DNA glycosylase